MVDHPGYPAFSDEELAFVQTMRRADILVDPEGRLKLQFKVSDEFAAKCLHALLHGLTAPLPPPAYTPAKPVVAESDPATWPTFPGEQLNYRGEDDPFGGEDIHTGGPR